MANKKWLITGTVIVAAVIAYVALRGPMFGPKGTEGTIGAANRYQSQQISDQDVSLDSPQVASFIQSDAFRKLASDQKFRQAAKHQSFNKIVSSDLREVSAKHDLGQVLGSSAVKTLLSDPTYTTAVTNGSLPRAIQKAPGLFTVTATPKLARLLKTPGLDQLATNADFLSFAEQYVGRIEGIRTAEGAKSTEELRRMDQNKTTDELRRMDQNKTTDELRRMDQNKTTDELRRMDQNRAELAKISDQLALSEFNKLLKDNASLNTSEAIRALEGNRYFPEALANGFMELFARKELAAFSVEGLRSIVEGNAFTEALKIDGFTQFTEALSPKNLDAAREIANSPEMIRVLSDGSYRDAALHAELSAVATAGLESAVQRIGE